MAVREVITSTIPIPLKRFVAAFYLACQRIIKKEDRINQLNVFPVSDKDTGTNLALTLAEIPNHISSTSTYQTYLRDVANTVFDNARGNSGVIFSIFIDALSNVAPNNKEISFDIIIDLFEQAYKHLSQEMSNVIEGTIISFMRDCLSLLKAEKTSSFIKEGKLDHLVEEMKTLLAKTQEQNPVLKRNEVIDAGAYALYLFFKSFIFSITSDSTIYQNNDTEDKTDNPSFSEHDIEEYPNYRFCTEGKLLLNEGVDPEDIKSIIHQSGDSELFLKRGNTLRFHVHANDPLALTTQLLKLGTLKTPKIDDLFRQYQMIHHRKHDVAIVTDSSADLPPNLYDAYPIFQIAQSIHIGENELLDRLNIDPDMLYQILPTIEHYPKTAAPTLGLIKYTLKVLKKYYKHILILTISSELSSTFNAISTLAKYDENIHVFDTLNNSGSHGFLIQYAAELLEQKKDIISILSKLEAVKTETQTFVVISNIDAAIRSGRLQGLKGWAAKMLHIKPLLTLDNKGRAAIISKNFSEASAINKMLSIIKLKHHEKPIQQYCILHAHAESKTTAFAQALTDIIGRPPMYMQSISPALGIHVGVGGIGVSYFQTPMPSSSNADSTPSSREIQE